MNKTQGALNVIMHANNAVAAKIIIVLNALMVLSKTLVLILKTQKNVLRHAL